jgi:bifunctional non-homologous end joining protein LigD
MRNQDYLCELLTPIEPQEAPGYVKDDRYLMQLKANGERLIVERYADRLFAFDRQGQITALPHHLAAALDQLGEDYMLDGERIGFGEEAHYVVWDLLRRDEDDLRGLPYLERFAQLIELLTPWCVMNWDECRPLPIRLIWTWGYREAGSADAGTDAFEQEKTKALVKMYESGAEGVCFKDKLAVFQNGRAGQHLKLKFWESCTCRVADKSLRADARLDKRSVALEMCIDDDGVPRRWLPMGFVTIPASTPLPTVGSFVDVRYLYAEAGGLYQPTFLGVRSDVDEDDCNLLQVKWYRSQEQIEIAMKEMIQCLH